MNPIPAWLKKIINTDPFFKACIITGNSKPEINHNFIYANNQINEPWALTPIITNLHRVAENCYHKCNRTREMADLIALTRATDEDFQKYNRFKWQQKKKYLLNKYSYEDFKNWHYNPYV